MSATRTGANKLARGRESPPLKIAYLFNVYPRPAQAAMRREIRALDALGVSVERFTVRRSVEALVDEAAEAERRRARGVLGVVAVGLLVALLKTMTARPAAFLRASRLAWKIARPSG